MNAFRNLNRPVAQAFDKEIIKVEKFVITGGKPLHGEVTISGAKNAAVGILPATILAADVCVIENLPDISDVAVSLKILNTLRCWSMGRGPRLQPPGMATCARPKRDSRAPRK